MSDRAAGCPCEAQSRSRAYLRQAGNQPHPHRLDCNSLNISQALHLAAEFKTARAANTDQTNVMRKKKMQ